MKPRSTIPLKLAAGNCDVLLQRCRPIIEQCLSSSLYGQPPSPGVGFIELAVMSCYLQGCADAYEVERIRRGQQPEYMI